MKIFKLIVQEMSDILKEALASSRVGGEGEEDDDEEGEYDTDDDDDDDEWEDEGVEAGDPAGDPAEEQQQQRRRHQRQQARASRMGVELSKMLSEPAFGGGPDNDGEEADEGEEDPDVLSDPLHALNLRQYLSRFLLEFCKQPYFPHFAQHLNPQEKRHLSNMGVSL